VSFSASSERFGFAFVADFGGMPMYGKRVAWTSPGIDREPRADAFAITS
jgi:hypothetical protein